MSKILKFTLISLFVVISVFSVKTETVQAKSNSVYEYNISDGEVYITNYKGSDIHVDIPSKIDGKPVVSIESECFNKSKIKTIYIPDSVREIHSDAFKECSALTGVIIGDGVEQLPYAPFNECKNLRYIIFGKNLCSASEPMYSYGNEGNLKCISISNPNFALYQDESTYGTITWTYNNSYGDYEICCEPKTTTFELFDTLGFPTETKDYANITFINSDKTLFTAPMVKNGTILTDLYALNDESGKTFSGWYSSSGKLIDKVGSSDITVYAKYATPPKAPTVKVVKVSDSEYKLTWNKAEGYYYQVEVKYATYKGNKTYKVLQNYKKNIGSYTAKVSKNYDCFFRVRCYKNIDGVKVYSDYSKDLYSSTPVYPAIYVTDYYLDFMQNASVDNGITFYNNSSKTIKSVIFTVTSYDINGEKVYDDYSDYCTFLLEDNESLKGNKSRNSYWEAVWFNSYTAYAIISKAEITYTDGSTKTVKMNVKGELVEKDLFGY